MGIVGALVLLILDFAVAPFVLSGFSSYVLYVFYVPFSLGMGLLSFFRERTGWPLSGGWETVLLPINWACYAVLGFFIGLKINDLFRSPS